MGTGQDISEVIRLERELLDPQVRCRPDLVRALLHPEFGEFGSTGQVFDTESVVQALASSPGPAQHTIVATDFEAASLSADVVLVTFRTHDPGRVVLRSSLWLRWADGRWLLRFHQGTVAMPDASRP